MSTVTAWLGVVLVTLCAVLAGWLEVLLVPLYLGSTIAPITIVFALASNWFLPRMARALVPSVQASVLPFVAWLVVVLVASTARPEGDVLLPGGSLQYVSYGLMLAGGLAGIMSIVLSLPPRNSPPQDGSGSSR